MFKKSFIISSVKNTSDQQTFISPNNLCKVYKSLPLPLPNIFETKKSDSKCDIFLKNFFCSNYNWIYIKFIKNFFIMIESL